MQYFFTCSFLLNMEKPFGYKLKSILPCVVDLRLPSSNEELKLVFSFVLFFF